MPVYPKKLRHDVHDPGGWARSLAPEEDRYLLRAQRLPLFEQVPPFSTPPHIVGNEDNDLVFDPRIIFSFKAASMQAALMRKADTFGNLEIGWFCLADWNQDGNIYVSECFLPKQTGSSGLTTEEIGAFWEEMNAKGQAELLPRINLWGHYHHQMSVDPSHQDDKGIRDSFGIGTKEWTVRLIVNRRGEARADVYLWKRDLVIQNCHCMMVNPLLHAVEEKQREVEPTWNKLVTFQHKQEPEEFDARGDYRRTFRNRLLDPTATESTIVSTGPGSGHFLTESFVVSTCASREEDVLDALPLEGGEL